MKTVITKTLLAAAASTSLALGASAGSFTSGIVETATEAGTMGIPASYTFNDVSGADYYDNDGDGFVSAGDVILGTFVLDSIATTAGSGGSAIIENVSGAYALQVDGFAGPAGQELLPGGGPSGVISFTSVSGTPQDGLVASVLGGFDGAIYEGGVDTISTLNPAPGAFAPATRWTDGDLQAGLALDSYNIFFNGTDLAALAALSDNFLLATIVGGSFTVVDDGTAVGDGLGDSLKNITGETVFVTGSVRSATPGVSPGPGSDFYFKDTATFSVTAVAVPSPSAAFAGLIGLAGLGMRRRRSSK